MIFLTVGTQLPFDRLVREVDEIARSHSDEFVAQIGRTEYKPSNMSFYDMLHPVDASNYFNKCKVVISHAGIGSVLSAKKCQKPIILVPRLAKFGEHRNDHQLATCSSLDGMEGIFVSRSTDQLSEMIERAIRSDSGKYNKHSHNDINKNLKRYLLSV